MAARPSEGATRKHRDSELENPDRGLTTRLFVEYSSLKKYCPLGVYVLPGANLRVWHGLIFIRNGDYGGGIFRFTLEMSRDYPAVRPKLRLESRVFHPLVDPLTGEVSLGLEFSEWNPDKHFLFLVLGYLKKIFYCRDDWTSAELVRNPEAQRLFLSNEFSFLAEVRRSIVKSEGLLQDDNEGPLQVKEYNACHEKVLGVLRKHEDLGEQERCQKFMTWFREQFGSN
jgi:ubiquitin-protein ligase